MRAPDRFATHTVENQPPPLHPLDAWAADAPLREAVAREGGDWARADLAAYGRLAGGPLAAIARMANEQRPKLVAFDPHGHRIDEVEFHPAYHQLMDTAIVHGVAGYAWRHEGRAGAHVARAALMYLHYQADQGTACPLTMTYACVPALRREPGIASAWLPKAIAAHYDPRHVPASAKRGVTIGMGMTEKQGGSDVRANTTRARPLAAGGPGRDYALVGHKWFFSAPMCDAFLVLAQAPGGLSCFMVPRLHAGGDRNGLRLQRLKDKLGDWSNASSEVEFHDAVGTLVGDEGRGVATILQMVALTRLDCMLGSAALMRHALVHAVHHARHRRAFGRGLHEQPLMRAVLADLALESEAATALAFRVARAVDAAERDPREAAFARLATALGKYHVCKTAPPFVAEALECLGGAGYVEESGLPRLYRQSPLNSIWEGSGNIQCLDVLRALGREPETAAALFAELDAARGADTRLDAEVEALRSALATPGSTPEAAARALAGRLAVALQAATLQRGEDPDVAAAFVATRIGGRASAHYGVVPADAPVARILERVLP